MNPRLPTSQRSAKDVVYIALRNCSKNAYPEMKIRVLDKFSTQNWNQILKDVSTTYLDMCLVRYNAGWSVESHEMFRRNMHSPSSGSKNKLRKKLA
jgi:hypothetical protein